MRGLWGLVIGIAFSCAVQAQIYKCVDERGIIHYSDKPRPGCRGGEVDIRPIPPVSGKAAPRSSDFAGEDAEFKRRRIEQEEAEARDQAAFEQRCARLRYEVGMLSSGTRIYKNTEQGERVYLDDAAREARLGQLKVELRRCR